MKINGKALGLAFAFTLACWAISWAITVDQIWNAVYITSSQSLRVTTP